MRFRQGRFAGVVCIEASSSKRLCGANRGGGNSERDLTAKPVRQSVCLNSKTRTPQPECPTVYWALSVNGNDVFLFNFAEWSTAATFPGDLNNQAKKLRFDHAAASGRFRGILTVNGTTF
jgi:hypothetical protein